MSKSKLQFSQTFNKGTIQGKEAVLKNIEKAVCIEIVKVSKYIDGKEIITYNVIL